MGDFSDERSVLSLSLDDIFSMTDDQIAAALDTLSRYQNYSNSMQTKGIVVSIGDKISAAYLDAHTMGVYSIVSEPSRRDLNLDSEISRTFRDYARAQQVFNDFELVIPP